MIKLSYSVDVISPLFLGGASPQTHSEIRAPSIRGQLRWWFRVLGGFKMLSPLPVQEQENTLFGTTAGDVGEGGKLIVRVSGRPPSQIVRDDAGMHATIYDPMGYFLFPLRTEKDGTKKARAVFNPDADQPCTFQLDAIWRGATSVQDDIHALFSVFLHLGSLGFRGRRAMGALASSKLLPLKAALERFSAPSNVSLHSLPATATVSDAIDSLAIWLKSWRAHGRTGNNEKEKSYPGFEYAKSDHDAACKGDRHTEAFRPALGLPIMTKYGHWGLTAPRGSQPSGRFASPVILRPYRAPDQTIRPLVIFVEKLKWPSGHHAFRGRDSIPVSLDLYDAMKADKRLTTFTAATN